MNVLTFLYRKLPNPSKANLSKLSMLLKNHKLMKVCSVLDL